MTFRGQVADPSRRVRWIALRGRLSELDALDAQFPPPA